MGLLEELKTIGLEDVDRLSNFLDNEVKTLISLLQDSDVAIADIPKFLTPCPDEPLGVTALRQFAMRRNQRQLEDLGEQLEPDRIELIQEGYLKGVTDMANFLMTIADLRCDNIKEE